MHTRMNMQHARTLPSNRMERTQGRHQEKDKRKSREQVATCHCVGRWGYREGFLEEHQHSHWKSGVQGVCGGEDHEELPGGQKNTGGILQSTQPA